MRLAMLGLRSIGETSGGIERHVQEIALRMAGQDHDVTVFCRRRYNSNSTDIFEGIRLLNRPAIYSKHLEALSHTAFCIPSVAFGYDIVHIHATGPSLLSWLPQITGRKVVVTIHGLDFLRAKWGRFATMVLKAGAWTAGKIPHQTIVVSQVLQEYYRKHYSQETTHIPNGVTQPQIRPLDRLKRYGVGGGDYILYLGRIVPEKGVHYLIEAFRKLDTDVKLIIAGDITHTYDYLSQLRELSAGDDRIIFTGALFGKQKDEAFSNAKAFVLPSEVEGMPIVLLEAMSYGCPVLVSNIPECMEVALPNFDACPLNTFVSGDIDSLRTSLVTLLKSNDLKEQGKVCREYVLKYFNWDRIAVDTIKIYQKALGLK